MAYFDQKISKFASYIQSGASILYRNICNDYLWPLMVETDMPVYVLTCFRVYSDLQDTKLFKNMPKIQILPPETEIINLVPEYHAETSSMTIYVHIWLILICEHAFCPVVGFTVISRAQNVVKNMPIIPILPPWIMIFQSGGLNIVQNIFNDYLWSYMIETDIPACVLTCCIGFKIISRTKIGQKYVKNTGFAPPLISWISNLVALY